ncbi:hypothetical protein WJX72_006557 [[Myrmecia] bisecta]|uniref:Uncharacterized protein n=1 Tax=[Myrmecia] bisecta TaxID=41462 RepID=A0AAW1Q1Z1_9CHLO
MRAGPVLPGCLPPEQPWLSLDYNELSGVWLWPDVVASLRIVFRLFLRGCGLQAVPSALCAMTQLQELDLNDNQLSSLPDKLTQLQGLKVLHLRGNRLSFSPAPNAVLSRLVALEKLDVSQQLVPVCIIGPLRCVPALLKLRVLNITQDRFAPAVMVLIDSLVLTLQQQCQEGLRDQPPVLRIHESIDASA